MDAGTVASLFWCKRVRVTCSDGKQYEGRLIDVETSNDLDEGEPETIGIEELSAVIVSIPVNEIASIEELSA